MVVAIMEVGKVKVVVVLVFAAVVALVVLLSCISNLRLFTLCF